MVIAAYLKVSFDDEKTGGSQDLPEPTPPMMKVRMALIVGNCLTEEAMMDVKYLERFSVMPGLADDYCMPTSRMDKYM